MTATRICLIRHGETDWNVQRRLQGQLDVELNGRGRAQARAVAKGVAGQAFAAIYSSDLARTMQTALVLAEATGLEVTPERGLRERHYGLFQGRTVEELAAHDPLAHASFVSRDPDYDYGGGESLNTFSRRIAQAIEGIVARHVGELLLLVTHGGVLDIVYRRAANRDLSSPRDFDIPNAALNWIEVGPRGWRVLGWADRRHLAETIVNAVE